MGKTFRTELQGEYKLIHDALVIGDESPCSPCGWIEDECENNGVDLGAEVRLTMELEVLKDAPERMVPQLKCPQCGRTMVKRQVRVEEGRFIRMYDGWICEECQPLEW